MQNYVKEYHTTGLVWNPRVRRSHRYPIFLFLLVTSLQGLTVEQFKASSTGISSAAGPPPPPPPPPPPSVSNANPVPPAVGAAAVFAELNRGEEVTKGLRKVDKSEMTHKNPALRASSVVPARPSSPSPGSPSPGELCHVTELNLTLTFFFCFQLVKNQPSPQNRKPLQARNLPSSYWTVISGL